MRDEDRRKYRRLLHLDVIKAIEGGDFSEAKELAGRLAATLQMIASVDFRDYKINEAPFFITREEAAFIADKLLEKPNGEKSGQSPKSGLELMTKVLIPNKRRSNRKYEERWLAEVAYLNIENTNEAEFERVAEKVVNPLVKNNEEILRKWKEKEIDSLDGYGAAIPEKVITADKLKKAYYAHKKEIEGRNNNR